MSQRLVFFGGTFDPVHHGHLIVARSLGEQLRAAAVTFVPAALPPHKPPARTTAEHRLAMLHLAVEGEGLLAVSDIELRRRGPSYTFDTMAELEKLHSGAELYWVIGADMLADLPRWHRAKELVERYTVIAVSRPPLERSLETVFAQLHAQFERPLVEKLRSHVLTTPLIEISSTQVRHRVGAGQSIRYLLPPAVQQYIADHKLYADASGPESFL